ncbi:DUF3168 domain-containing protein [Paralimibaculum aggregatum]|uniref:DUF3168 domain-containing protein n=1 Tax=Paralimibaculum aggregatum TaxID=3036245 RepID=A0ABQ6LK64_9RHOB|nr:DUF3168 domain-containing protein [Limibaculum sp. NKW23]GMG82584.1 DUF3168 domain-containing protein [Limibaculum sp. NKW23]
MSADSRLEVQKAVLAALDGDTTLTALVGGRIFDRARADVAFPYISFGPSTMQDWDTDGGYGAEVILQVDAWSRAGGKVECLRIQARVHALLHDAALSLDTHRFVLARLDLPARAFTDPDGETTHGVQQFRFLTQEPA